MPTLISPCPRQREQSKGNAPDHQPGEALVRRSRRHLLELDAVGQRRLDVRESRAVAVEVLERLGAFGVDLRQHTAKRFVQVFGRISPDYGHQRGERPRFRPDSELAETQRIEPLPLGERVADEVLDGGQHGGHELRILARCIERRRMRDQQAGMAMDQEDVLDPVDQGMLQHDLGERHSRTPRLPAPFQSAPGQAVLQRLVQRLERRIDRLADGRSDQRMKDVDERVGIASDRAAQSRCQHLAETFIARRRLRDGRGENAAHGDCQLLRIVQHLVEMPGQLDLTAKQQPPHLLEPRIERNDAGRLYVDFGINISGQLDQQPRKHSAIKAAIDRSG